MFQKLMHGVLTIAMAVVMLCATSLAQSSAQIYNLPADITQKLQSLFDEDTVECSHRVSLEQEQKQLSDRPLPERRQSSTSFFGARLTPFSGLTPLTTSFLSNQRTRAPPLSEPY